MILTNDNISPRGDKSRSQGAEGISDQASTLLSEEQLERLRQGVELSDGPTRPAVVERLRDGPKHTFLEMTITEGRNRQVRRMLEAVESKVSKLVRIAIGPVRIDDLVIGKWRNLSADEVQALRGERKRQSGPRVNADKHR